MTSLAVTVRFLPSRKKFLMSATQLLTPWRGAIIRQPSLFVAGACDDVLKFPSARLQVDNFAATLPALRGCHVLEGVGH